MYDPEELRVGVLEIFVDAKAPYKRPPRGDYWRVLGAFKQDRERLVAWKIRLGGLRLVTPCATKPLHRASHPQLAGVVARAGLTAYRRGYREELRAAGACRECRGPSDGSSRCPTCRAKRRKAA